MQASDVMYSRKLPVEKTKWTRKGKLLLLLYTLSLIYISVPILLHSPLYEGVILMPFKATKQDFAIMDQASGRAHEEYSFKNHDGDTLNAVLWRQPGSRKIVIYHHGNAGNISHRATACAAVLAAGANAFAYDYRAYGKSTGQASLNGVLDDGLSAYEFVTTKLKFAPENVINYGESLGAGPACAVASKRESGGLILESGIPSLPMVGRDHFAFLRPYPDFLFPQPQMNNLELVKCIHCPVAVINGALDTTVTEAMARQVYANANETKYFVLLKGSGHNSVSTGPDVRAYLRGMSLIINGPSSISVSAAVDDRVAGGIDR